MHGSSIQPDRSAEPPAVDLARLDEHAVEVLSHELRSPITTIHLGAKVLRLDAIAAPVREAVLEAVDVEADRLLRVVEDLLAVMRHGTGARLRSEPVLLQRRVGAILGDEPVRPGGPPRIRFPEGLPAVLADEAALGQVLRNLVSNADHHGASRVPTELVAEPGPPGRVSVSVLDQGPGIPATESQRVFEPFYRCPGTIIPGAGLGLAAARSLTRAMGGEISVGPRPGGGTVATVMLRVADPGD